MTGLPSRLVNVPLIVSKTGQIRSGRALMLGKFMHMLSVLSHCFQGDVVCPLVGQVTILQLCEKC